LATLLISEAEWHAARVAQGPIWLSTGDQNLVGLASLQRAPGRDRELFALAVFVLEPSGAATPGLVGRVKALGHHAL
jgi:hypothetical protein